MDDSVIAGFYHRLRLKLNSLLIYLCFVCFLLYFLDEILVSINSDVLILEDRIKKLESINISTDVGYSDLLRYKTADVFKNTFNIDSRSVTVNNTNGCIA